MRKVVTKSNISKGQKLFFLVKCSVAASMKFLYDVMSIFARIQEKCYMGNVHARLGPVVVANIAPHFYISCVNIFS